MLTNQLAVTYAEAMFALATEKNILDQVEAELTAVAQGISSHEDLSILMYHPHIPHEAKKETLKQVFAGELSEYVANFLSLLIDKRRETALPAIVREYCNLADAARNIAEAEVTTVMPLAEREQSALAAKLSAVTGKNIRLKIHEDKRILGGIVVKLGDKLIDGSVARQLETLQAALLKTELTKIGVTD